MKRLFPCFLLFSLLSVSINAFSQFEQKLTINASGTFVYPDAMEEYSSFGNGYGVDGGLQYNFNRTLSMYGAVRFYYMFGSASYEDAYYDNIAFGAGLKLNLLPTRRINPYLFGEANLNFIWLEEYLYQNETYSSDYGTSIGGFGGGGIDFRLNDNLAFFVQSGGYYTLWDGRINLYSQFGVRINLIKSKTI